ncbi:GPALPP motifs-containing protein 1-like [Uloborus diversus]|uniref:GPALPP motifs-containing protein 1-like n=1 Tax=Uloborus diversus TaxID=327109 RepID=UPI002409645C|nr:GPALPP motifs-containing protein 1-like [Uloborus diversus]
MKMDDLYGPPLPPGFNLPSKKTNESTSSSHEESCSSKLIGPQIPNFLSVKKSNDKDAAGEQEDKNERKFIGPKIPSSLHGEESGSDEEYVGPMPSHSNEDAYNVVKDIEKRATSMKNKLDNQSVSSSDKIEREEWMVVPDTSRRNQLGAISRCLAPGSKSDSSKKEKRSHRQSEKDKKTTEDLKKYNKSRRSESLLELHRKDKKKKKEKSDKPKERKAFDRDEIAVRHFSNQQVNSVIDKAKYLNKRFHSGAEQYL